MLSDVTYPRISGTHVAGDFVEFPSQLFEHWIQAAGDAAPLRAPLINRRADAGRADGQASRRAPFNQGWATVEYTASALVDLKLHLDPDARRGRRRRLRAGGARADRHARGDRHATPHAALPAYFLGRLFGRLLQLSMVGDARRRRVRGFRGEPATSSIRAWPAAREISFMRPAAAAIMTRPTGPFAAARRRPKRSSASGGWPTHLRRMNPSGRMLPTGMRAECGLTVRRRPRAW